MTWLNPGIPSKNVKKRGNNLVKLSTSRPSALHKLCTGTHGDIVARLQHHSYTLGFNGSTSDRKYFLSPKMNQGFFHMGIQCGFLKQNSYMFWTCGGDLHFQDCNTSLPIAQYYQCWKAKATLSHPVRLFMKLIMRITCDLTHSLQPQY